MFQAMHGYMEELLTLRRTRYTDSLYGGDGIDRHPEAGGRYSNEGLHGRRRSHRTSERWAGLQRRPRGIRSSWRTEQAGRICPARPRQRNRFINRTRIVGASRNGGRGVLTGERRSLSSKTKGSFFFETGEGKRRIPLTEE